MANKLTIRKTPAAVSVPDTVERRLTKAQESLLEVLQDPRVVNLDVAQICKLANITRPTYYEAFRSETFMSALENSVQTMLAAAEPRVIMNITAKAMDPATKSHHWALMVEKMRGRLEEKNQKPAQITVNFGNIQRPAIKISPIGSMIINGEPEEEHSEGASK